MNASEKKLLKFEAHARLAKLVHPHTTVYTVLKHTSASGMSRRFQVLIVSGGDILDITGNVARLLDLPFKNGELTIRGCGSDMGYQIVCDMSFALFKDGQALDHWKI